MSNYVVDVNNARGGWSSRGTCPVNHHHAYGLELRIAWFVWMGSRMVDWNTTAWFGHGVGPCNVQVVHAWHVPALATMVQ